MPLPELQLKGANLQEIQTAYLLEAKKCFNSKELSVMNILIIFVLIIVVAAILAALKAKQPSKDGGHSFDRKDALFSPAERSFLGILDQVLDQRYRVYV
jgi:hypothetical protein